MNTKIIRTKRSKHYYVILQESEVSDANNGTNGTHNDVVPSAKLTDEMNVSKGSVTGVLPNGMVSKLTARTRPGNINVLTCKAGKQMPGHTGYLTFASLYPVIVDVKTIKEE